MKYMQGRTDLAIELSEEVESEEKIEGVRIFTKINRDNDIVETKIYIDNEQGVKTIGKPIGKYITIESAKLQSEDEDIHEPMMKVLLGHLKDMIGDNKKVLVAGLGNREITPDALGPLVVDNLYITRHLFIEGYMDKGMVLSAIAPGVMAQTGVETSDILLSIVDKTKPDVLVVIDALAARDSDRLIKTIQLADTGIAPGSGVGNHRVGINEDTMGIKVIAIGVPTVISVPAIVKGSLETMVELITNKDSKVLSQFSEEEKYELAYEIVSKTENSMREGMPSNVIDMFVTPKNIDQSVKKISYTISEAINKL